MKSIKTVLHNLFVAPLALLLVFEEWGWEPLSRGLTRLARLPLWAGVERTIQRLPPWGALLVFVGPVLALLPVKLLALYLFGAGRPLMGLTLLVAAKLLGTAAMARLFQLTQPTLMQYRWFARLYPRWKSWKDGVTSWIRASRAWQQARAIKVRVKAWWRSV